MITVTSAQSLDLPQAEPLLAAFATPQTNLEDIDVALEQYREWISRAVYRFISHRILPGEEIAEEIDDLIQVTLIAFWLRLVSENEQIVSPQAYITVMVRSRCIDLVRRQKKQKRVQRLSFGDDGEPYQDDVLARSSNGEQDPSLEYDYKESLVSLVNDILQLPPCQQRAMICLLKDEVQDMPLLCEIFWEHGRDLHAVNWPQDAVELQRLRSSLTIARRKLRALRDAFPSET